MQLFLDWSKLKALNFADDKNKRDRKWWLPECSPFPTMFSKCFFSPKVMKSLNCVVKNKWLNLPTKG